MTSVADQILSDAGFDPVAIRNQVRRVQADQPMHHARNADGAALPAERLIASWVAPPAALGV